jgi:DNA-binding transcriptional ArsR family regulator
MARRAAAALRTSASVFAALGDETRLGLLAKLTRGEPQSIARLTSGTRLTRQAVTKHLRVLEGAGVVRSARVGRESRFVLDPKPIDDVRTYLDDVSRQWDNALARLKALVEER